jgi:RNA polymerase sigma-70 factor (ECF subfamily)
MDRSRRKRNYDREDMSMAIAPTPVTSVTMVCETCAGCPSFGVNSFSGSGQGALVNAARTELLVRLLTRHQEELFRYIYALLPHDEDARDVLQETSVALSRKFAEYDPTKPFLAWACGFAYLEILKQRERNQRGTRYLKRELIERLAREREQHEPVLHARLQALEHCLQELAPSDRQLIQQRYQGKTSVEELVRQDGSSRRTVFRKLDRIRRQLHACISRCVAATEFT